LRQRIPRRLVYTATGGHRAVIEIAARHGLAVMVEKPLTLSHQDALAIRRLAREHHIAVLTNYETTWYASNRAAIDELESGKLGTVRRVVIHDGHKGPKEIHMPDEFLSWLGDPKQGGAGALYDFGCYGADLMTRILHGQSPLTVTEILNHDKPESYPKADDDATVILTYPGSQAVLQASWNWPFDHKDIEVYGATGYAMTVSSDRVRLRHAKEAAEREEISAPLPANEKDSLSYLGAVLRKEIEPKSDLTALDTNVVVMQILDAARESARSGRIVTLAKLKNEQ
jgi:predicted dehydrogenase